MNLLVLRLATINAEEQVQERLEAAEARRNAVHLEGDVIQPNTRLFNTTEKPEQVETISVCSCACLDYKIWHHHGQQQQQQQQNQFPHQLNHQSMPKGIRKRSSLGNNKFKDDSSVMMSESGVVGSIAGGGSGGGGGIGGIGGRRKWRTTFLTPTLKRLLPGRFHRRLASSKHSQYFIASSNPNSLIEQNEFEMMLKTNEDDRELKPVKVTVTEASNSPPLTQLPNQQSLGVVNNGNNPPNMAETNLLNLDAIDLCSPNVKRNSI